MKCVPNFGFDENGTFNFGRNKLTKNVISNVSHATSNTHYLHVHFYKSFSFKTSALSSCGSLVLVGSDIYCQCYYGLSSSSGTDWPTAMYIYFSKGSLPKKYSTEYTKITKGIPYLKLYSIVEKV